MKNLLATTALVGLSFFAAAPAYAACSDPSPGLLGSSTCADADTTGVSSTALVVTVTVTSTGSITTAGAAVWLTGAAAKLNVSGAVTSTGTEGAVMGATSMTEVFSGGSISGSTTGVSAGSASTLTINAGGSVSGATGVIFQAGGINKLNVYGTLTGTGGTAASLVDNSNSAEFTMSDQASITGNVIAGATTGDKFTYVATDNNLTFNTGLLDTKYQGFEIFTKNGAYTWFLGGATAKNWTLNDGTNYADITNIANANVTSGILVLSGDGTYSGDLGGAGLFIRDGGGSLTFTGDNTIGEFRIRSNADVTLADAGAAGSSIHSVQNSTLRFGYDAFSLSDVRLTGNASFDTGAHDGSFTNVTGAGSLIKIGSGTLTLTGSNTYSGATGVNAGKLVVDGTANAVSSTTIASGATLGGSGTVRNVTVQNGGTFAPGNSIGTLNVTGSLAFDAGSHYAVEYDNASADKTIATGAITVDNAAILDLTGTGAVNTFAANQTYTILQGASVTGTFGTLNNNLAFLDAAQNNTGTTLDITLSRNDIAFADTLDPDEQDVGEALTEMGTNDLTTAFTGLTEEEAKEASKTLSNEQQGATASFATTVNTNVLANIGARMGQAFGSFGNLVSSAPPPSDTYVAAYLEPSAGGAFNRESNVWMQAVGSIGRSDSTSTKPSQDRHSFGAIAGIDIAYADDGFYGIFAGYERGEVETDSQNASSSMNNYHLGGYTTHGIGNGLQMNGGVALTYHDIDSVRYVVMPGFDAAPQSNTQGYSASGFIELSKPVKAYDFAFAPFVNATLAHTHINGYTEENGGSANLVVDDSDTTNPMTVLGARFAKTAQWNERTLNLTGSLGWQHVFGEIGPETGMRFESGTASFNSSGAPRARNAALIGLRLNAEMVPGMKAYAGYSGNLSSESVDHGFEAGMKWEF